MLVLSGQYIIYSLISSAPYLGANAVKGMSPTYICSILRSVLALILSKYFKCMRECIEDFLRGVK